MLNTVAMERSAAPTRMVPVPKPAVTEGFLPIGHELFEYRIEKVLGRGGFGVTYLARDTHLDKPVAIKEYLPTELAYRNGTHVSVRSAAERDAFAWGLQQFLKEARTLARFSHPNLVPVHRYFQANDTAYFVMQYVEGRTFASRLKRQPEVSEGELCAVLLPVLRGLEAVHAAGVLHRDIKPENILLRRDGTPVLIDFGAARLTLNEMTRSAIATLTAGYAPIEQYGMSGRQGPWTDIYALGAMAYRAITGRKPPEAVCRVINDPLIPASVCGYGRFSPAFLAAIDAALAVNPEQRPQSIGAWLATLEAALAEPAVASSELEVVVETPVAAATTARPWAKLRSAVSGLVALVVCTLPFAALRGSQAAEPAPAAAVTIAAATMPALSLGLTQVDADANADPAPSIPQRAKARAVQVASARPAAAPVRDVPLAVQAREALSSFRDCMHCPEMVVLPAGFFQMGASGGEAKQWEGPVHAVTLRKSFALGRYEVTAGQWQACVAAGACARPATAAGGANLPVVGVSHDQARAYVAWLSRVTHRHYRLPSEAEWEYAARAGTSTSRFWGDDAARQCAFANGRELVGRRGAKAQAAPCTDGHAALTVVGSLRPNGFALYDMAGNAWEWTADCWNDSYATTPRDGSAADNARCTARVIRGGGWRSVPDQLRSATRGQSAPGVRSDTLGFRVVAD